MDSAHNRSVLDLRPGGEGPCSEADAGPCLVGRSSWGLDCPIRNVWRGGPLAVLVLLAVEAQGVAQQGGAPEAPGPEPLVPVVQLPEGNHRGLAEPIDVAAWDGETGALAEPNESTFRISLDRAVRDFAVGRSPDGRYVVLAGGVREPLDLYLTAEDVSWVRRFPTADGRRLPANFSLGEARGSWPMLDEGLGLFACQEGVETRVRAFDVDGADLGSRAFPRALRSIKVEFEAERQLVQVGTTGAWGFRHPWAPQLRWSATAVAFGHIPMGVERFVQLTAVNSGKRRVVVDLALEDAGGVFAVLPAQAVVGGADRYLQGALQMPQSVSFAPGQARAWYLRGVVRRVGPAHGRLVAEAAVLERSQEVLLRAVGEPRRDVPDELGAAELHEKSVAAAGDPPGDGEGSPDGPPPPSLDELADGGGLDPYLAEARLEGGMVHVRGRLRLPEVWRGVSTRPVVRLRVGREVADAPVGPAGDFVASVPGSAGEVVEVRWAHGSGSVLLRDRVRPYWRTTPRGVQAVLPVDTERAVLEVRLGGGEGTPAVRRYRVAEGAPGRIDFDEALLDSLLDREGYSLVLVVRRHGGGDIETEPWSR